MEIIKTEDLRLYYGDFLALKGINISINDKEITATDGSFVTKLNTDSGISTVAVENQKGFSLPETGGIGIMIFLGIGIVGILILSGIMVKKMKL